jgi:4-amino-4-deoxy-L-arabinose transferase-like glycosyltransferase
MNVSKVSQEPRQRHAFNAWSQQQTPDLLPLALVLAGFLLRFGLAWLTFLNPDEILHYLLADQPSLRQAYQASLTTAHPPLFILFLYYWRMLGNAEWILRLPSVLAGTAFCWIIFLWLNKVANRSAALTALALLLFCPSLIYLSTEVRQYALLLLFSALALYFLERALAENSGRMMVLSFVVLCLALLTHYSALILALSLGIYAVIRLYRNMAEGSRPGILITWIVGQVIALGLCAFLYVTHISQLKSSGQPLEIETWLASSIYHRGHDHLVVFVFRNSIRLFHFLFSQGAVGVLGFLCFLIGVIGLGIGKYRSPTLPGKPSSRQLGLLLVLPFVINCGLAITGLYPYGGTRHNALLASFAMSGIAIACSRWTDAARWGKSLLLTLALVLAVCNLFPNPAGAYIRPSNQRKQLMEESVEFMGKQIPPGSILFTDNGGGLSLSYYFCHQRVIQYELPFHPFLQSNCRGLHVITPAPNFKTLPDRLWLSEIDPYVRATPAAPIWFFQAGWIAGKEDVQRTLLQTGCRDPRRFGQNILLCQL